jgi:RNAse (barnase) inhibitor barstar
MCYDDSKWEDAYDAILKSSLALPQYCLRNTDASIEYLMNNIEIKDIPAYFEDPMDHSKTIQTNKDTLTYDF